MTETGWKFIAATGASMAGTVAVGGTAHAAPPLRPGPGVPVVAYVADHGSSEVRLLVGEREVVLQDRDLVTRILNAAGGR